jgi:uncharacterized protein with FMN-binding domain
LKLNRLFFISGVFTLFLLTGLTGCPTDDDDAGTEAEKPLPIAGNPTGSAAKSAPGFAKSDDYLAAHGETEYGADVTVTVTVTEGYITGVEVDGPDESPDIGGEAIIKLTAQIKAKNSFDVDKISGASYTSAAVKTAGQAALAQIIADNT